MRSTLPCCLLCLCSHDAVIDPDSEDKVHVAVDGLGGKFVILYVGKKEGKEKEKLLADEGGTDEEDEEEEGGLWSRYSGVECSGCWRGTGAPPLTQYVTRAVFSILCTVEPLCLSALYMVSNMQSFQLVPCMYEYALRRCSMRCLNIESAALQWCRVAPLV